MQKRSVQVAPSRVKIAESARNVWVINAPQGAVVEDLQDPSFWSLIAQQLRPGDKIEVRADDFTWYAEGLVHISGRTWAKVLITFFHSFVEEEITPADNEDFDAVYKGPENKWVALRIADGQALKTGFDTRDLARAWLFEYQKAL